MPVLNQFMLHALQGYVEQFDSLIPSLTVTEMLMYTAEVGDEYGLYCSAVSNMYCL